MAATHFKGPIYSNGLEVPTLSADGTSLVSGGGESVLLSPQVSVYPDPRMLNRKTSIPLDGTVTIYETGSRLARVIGVAVTNSSAAIDVAMSNSAIAIQSATATAGPYMYPLDRELFGNTSITLGANARGVYELEI